MTGEKGLSGKVVLVTGGSRGIGRGICGAFLDQGAGVYTCGRHAPEEAIRGNTASAATFIKADVREPEQVEQLIQQIISEQGRLDCLVNNAGGGPPMDAASALPKLTEAIIRLNLLAPLLVSQKSWPALKQHRGSIINIASVSALRASPGSMAYGAAKAGLLSATLSLAQEWAPEVRVNAIIAGLIKTEAAQAHYGGAAGIAALEARLPARRMGMPDDIAQACLYLADGDKAAYISGASLAVYGGGEPPGLLAIVAEAGQPASR